MSSKKRRIDENSTDVDKKNETKVMSDIITQVYENQAFDPRQVQDCGVELLRDKAVELQALIRKLHNAIDAAKEISLMGSQPQSNKQVIRNVLDHSHRTSYTTGAPAGYIPGQSQLYMVKPPAPQTMQFQNSILHTAFSQHEKQLYVEHHGDQDKKNKKVQSAEEDQAAPVTLDTKSVELLKHLPPMPKEWKPGDPIPGLDTVDSTKESLSKVEKMSKKPATFAFSLNPDMDVEFGIEDSDDDSSSEDD